MSNESSIHNNKCDIIIDHKLNCCSIMEKMMVSDYLNFITPAYKDKGGIKGQREPLKQKTAITIRKRMINDIIEGTILPPIVIGIIVNEDIYHEIIKSGDIWPFFENNKIHDISIIDGMQRTTAILEALEQQEKVSNYEMRVEFWISYDVNSMLYRMLVLNTGQVPWNMRRQVELIFDSIIKKIKHDLPNITIYAVDDNQRRSRSGQYNAKDLIEAFLAFGARTWKIDVKEKVANEFTRGDIVQSAEETNIVNEFCKVLTYMYQWDQLLDSKMIESAETEGNKFRKGKDLFGSQPARVGLFSACGEYIFGRPGEKKTDSFIEERKQKLDTIFKELLDNLNSTQDLDEMMDFSTLSEVIIFKNNKVGDYERDKFYSAFKVLLEMGGNIESFTVCWRA